MKNNNPSENPQSPKESHECEFFLCHDDRVYLCECGLLEFNGQTFYPDPQIENHINNIKWIQKANSYEIVIKDSIAIFKYLIEKDSFNEKYSFTSHEMRHIIDKVDKLQS